MNLSHGSGPDKARKKLPPLAALGSGTSTEESPANLQFTPPPPELRRDPPKDLGTYDVNDQADLYVAEPPCSPQELMNLIQSIKEGCTIKGRTMDQVQADLEQGVAGISADKVPELIKNVLKLLRRTDPGVVASPKPSSFRTLEQMEEHAQALEKTALALKSALDSCTVIFDITPGQVLKVFAEDVLRRMGQTRISSQAFWGLVTDRIDLARLTMIKASGVGFKEEDTLHGAVSNLNDQIGSKKDPAKSVADAETPAPPADGREEWEIRRDQKRAQRMAGAPAYQRQKDAAQVPAETAPSIGESDPQQEDQTGEIKQNIMRDFRARMEDCQPTEAHKILRRLKPVSISPGHSASQEKWDMLRDDQSASKKPAQVAQNLVYSAARSAAHWMELELGLPDSPIRQGGTGSVLLSPQASEERAIQAREEFERTMRPLLVMESILRASLTSLFSRARMDQMDLTSCLNEQELFSVRQLTSNGMDAIIQGRSDLLSAKVVQTTREQLREARAARTQDRSNWRKHLWDPTRKV